MSCDDSYHVLLKMRISRYKAKFAPEVRTGQAHVMRLSKYQNASQYNFATPFQQLSAIQNAVAEAEQKGKNFIR